MAELFIILGLIILNGVLSMTEMAMVSARKAKLEVEANQGNQKSKNALKYLNAPDDFLSTIQIGITLIGILTGIFSGQAIRDELTSFLSQFDLVRNFSRSLSTGIIVLLVTYFTLIFGELVPKRLGLTNPEKITKSMVPAMSLLSKITYPFIRLLSFSTQSIVKILKIRPGNNSVTEEEIKAMIEEGTKQGEIEVAEKEIISRLFHLGDRSITSLMTHRSEIFWLDVSMSIEDANEYIKTHLHSIYPVCENNLDNIKGIVRTKDLYASGNLQTLHDCCKPALFVPENNTTYQVMEKFKAKGTNVCFIIDEYGSLEGMVTINDIFETLVGDIPESDPEEPDILKREDGSYLANAQMHFFDFLEFFDLEDKYKDRERFDTLAGFILQELQHIPKEGERFEWGGFTFEIIDMDGNRIDKVLVIFK